MKNEAKRQKTYTQQNSSSHIKSGYKVLVNDWTEWIEFDVCKQILTLLHKPTTTTRNNTYVCCSWLGS